MHRMEKNTSYPNYNKIYNMISCELSTKLYKDTPQLGVAFNYKLVSNKKNSLVFLKLAMTSQRVKITKLCT